MKDSTSHAPEQRLRPLRDAMPDLVLMAAGLFVLGWLMAASYALAADTYVTATHRGNAMAFRTHANGAAALHDSTHPGPEPSLGFCAATDEE